MRGKMASTIRPWLATGNRFIFFHKRLVILVIISGAILYHLAQISNSEESFHEIASYRSKWFDGLRSNEAAAEEKPVNLVTFLEPELNKNYMSMIAKYGPGLANRPFADRCHLYFRGMYEERPEWRFESFSTIKEEGFDRKLLSDRKAWVKDRLKEVMERNKEEFRKKHPDDPGMYDSVDKWYSESEEDRIEVESYKLYERFTGVDNELIRNVKALAVYSKCYNHDAGSDLYQELVVDKRIEDIEDRMFPYLTRKRPVYVRWTGEKVVGAPDMVGRMQPGASESAGADKAVEPDIAGLDADIYRIEDVENVAVNRSVAFFNEFKREMNGKGIVMSVSDQFVEDALSLVRTLRTVGNKLPVQIVHRGDLSPESQLRLVQEAREKEVAYPREEYEYLRGVADQMPYFDTTFPPQDLWFVNIEPCIADAYKKTFQGFINKLLAYVFNSFDEMLLVDSDIVPYVNPARFFTTSQYLRSKSLFFKDRTHDEGLFQSDVDFFAKMMPHDVDRLLFNMSTPTNRTLANRYMRHRLKHYMESGVVAVKRSDYWDGVLVALQLSSWTPVLERVWGDKELFWLSQSIVGNEQYEFNDNHVAAVGQLTDPQTRLGLKAKEICATHPGHISSDDSSLLWINSGVETCKRSGSSEGDFNEQAKKGFKSKQDLKNYYESALKITDAIIPPDSGLYSIKNPFGEPQRGWKTTNLCWGYFWCAYSAIGGSSAPEHQGVHIHFNETMAVWHDYVSKVYRGKF